MAFHTDEILYMQWNKRKNKLKNKMVYMINKCFDAKSVLYNNLIKCKLINEYAAWKQDQLQLWS